MTQLQERIEDILHECREYGYSPALIAALSDHLSGRPALTQVQQEWQAGLTQRTMYINPLENRLAPHSAGLDEVDARLLEVFHVIDSLATAFKVIAPKGLLPQAHELLVDSGMREIDLLDQYLQVGRWNAWMVFKDNQPTELGVFLLRFIPQHLQDIIQLVAQNDRNKLWTQLIRLLLSADPPLIDAAWQVAQSIPAGAQNCELGDAAALLLNADPTRFSAWARQIAGSNSPGDNADRNTALEALMKLDMAAHLDLALAAFHTTLGYATFLQWNALQAIFRFDPQVAWPLLEIAVVSPDEYLGRGAVMLLGEVDPERARPLLQQGIAKGHPDAALKALEALRERPWPEWDAYLASQLVNRSKKIRNVVVEWLVEQGEAALEQAAPFLDHRSADARLAAVQVLSRVGGERARALLVERLEVEPAPKVKRAILDAVGPLVESAPATEQPAAPEPPATPVAAFLAEAEATIQHLPPGALGPVDPDTGLYDHAPLRWANGEPLPIAAVRYLLYRQSLVKEPELAPELLPVIREIDRSASGDWAFALWDSWSRHDVSAKTSGVLMLAGALGDDRLIAPLREKIEAWTPHGSGERAARLVYVLAALGSDRALAEVDAIANQVRHKRVRPAAQQAYARAAQALGISRDDLEDRLVPQLGLDARGERVFRYGPRQFIARLRPDLTPQLHDAAGKRITTLPKPTRSDDQEQAALAQAEWKAFKQAIKQAAKLQRERLARALTTQRRWEVERWRELFLSHPLLRSLATQFVWVGGEPQDLGSGQTFRPLEDGTLTNADDEPMELPTSGQVWLAHPVDLDDKLCQAWLRHLADYEVSPPFPQMSRPVVHLQPDERDAIWWSGCAGLEVNGAVLKRRFLGAGWERGSVQDAGIYSTLIKRFPGAAIEAVLETSGLLIGLEETDNVTLLRLAFIPAGTMRVGSSIYDDLQDNDERAMRLGDVPPVIFSEAAADVRSFVDHQHT